MNSTQIKSIIATIATAVAAFLAQKFPLLDVATWNLLVTAVATAIISGILAKFTSVTSMADSIAPAGQSATKVVTTPEVAAALPNNPNVVSTTEVKVTPK